MGHAEVAELVDALGSGSSGGFPVEVQVLSSALSFCFLKQIKHIHITIQGCVRFVCVSNPKVTSSLSGFLLL
jgi:hypothetical protein